MPAGEGSEADPSEGRSKRQKERERGGEGAGRRFRPHRPGCPGCPGRASTPTSESDHRRGKFGSRKGRIRAASLLGVGIASGDHVRPTTSRGLNSGGWAARPVRGRAESGDKIKERVECSEGRGRGGKGSFIVAKRRERRDARSGRLNRKRQRTGNGFYEANAPRPHYDGLVRLTAYSSCRRNQDRRRILD
jgi:hypothetical protein